MAEELPLQCAHEAGSIDSRLHHAEPHDVACSISHSRDMTNQMQHRATVNCIASYNEQRNAQHRSKKIMYTQTRVQLATK